MTKKILLLITLILSSSFAVLAQSKMYEPKKGSAERKSLMNAIRAYDVARNNNLKGEIFEITSLQVQGKWAFTSVERTNLQDAGMGTHLAFLRKSGAGWKLMWSDYNDQNEVGVDALTRLRQKYKDFYQKLADFAESHLAG